MKRKETLLFMLDEVRNELANALEDLTQEQLAARPLEGQNPIGWIVCHCMRNASFFLHEARTGAALLSELPRGPGYDRYARADPDDANLAPDLSEAIADLDCVYALAIARLRDLDEEAFDQPASFWQRERPETVASSCVRVINHSNAHIREIWLLRWALGDRQCWPHQTLYRLPDGDGFYVPDRATILARRQGR